MFKSQIHYELYTPFVPIEITIIDLAIKSPPLLSYNDKNKNANEKTSTLRETKSIGILKTTKNIKPIKSIIDVFIISFFSKMSMSYLQFFAVALAILEPIDTVLLTLTILTFTEVSSPYT